MTTVAVKLYRVICENCGYDVEFCIGAHPCYVDAVGVARWLHVTQDESQRRLCPDDHYLTVSLIDRNSSPEES